MASSEAEERPEFSPTMSASEFYRWYWTLEELQTFARRLGLRATGAKRLVAARIAASLQNESFIEPLPRNRPAPDLVEPLSPATVLPRGQRCTQQVRAWLTSQIGPAFRFDKHMRDFFGGTDGTQTLDDALHHWHSTRDAGREDIEEQFELNRFTRNWHAAHPGASKDELREAWKQYRSQPADRRRQA